MVASEQQRQVRLSAGPEPQRFCIRVFDWRRVSNFEVEFEDRGVRIRPCGNVNPAPPDVENEPRLTSVALLPIATVVSTPLNVSVAVLAPVPSVTVFVPEPAQASDRRHVNTPSVLKAPFSENESARAAALQKASRQTPLQLRIS